jgi:2-dehydropantoate 2-reductase
MIKFGFIGAGAIGSLFGGYLANIKGSEMDISLFCSHDHAIAIKNHGLKIKTENGIITIKNLNIYDRTNEESFVKNFDFDYLILTTKTYDTKGAINQYLNIIKRCKWFVILQNGLGNEEIVQQYVKKDKIMRIVTSHGAILTQPGHVTHTGKGFTYVGLPCLKSIESECDLHEENLLSLDRLNSLLNLAEFNSKIELDILTRIWQKALVNIGINAIGALTHLNNGKLISNEGLSKLMEEAVIEAFEVGSKMNISLSKDDCISLTYSVANKTYYNKNSMLQDILIGKRTEIDYLNGKIVDFAKRMGIKVPVNEVLTSLIKGLESGL